MKRSHAQLLILTGVLLVAYTTPALADGIDSLTETSLKDKIGGIVKTLGGISALVIAAVGFITAGYKAISGSDDVMVWVKRTLLGSGLCASAWALAKLFIGEWGR